MTDYKGGAAQAAKRDLVERKTDGPVKLSDRLTAISKMVDGKKKYADDGAQREGYCLCDVGTDHAHIPIRLLQEGVIDTALAMDVIRGPLEKARDNLALYGCSRKVTLRLSDGLDAYVPGEAQGLVIAGMGGRIMGKILLREPDKTRDFKELVLQPQADPEVVRGALRRLDFAIDRERLIHEDGKFYPVMHAVRGAQRHPDWDEEIGEDLRLRMEDLFGPDLLSGRDEVLREFLLWRRDANLKILGSLQNAQEPESGAVLKKQEDVRQMLRLIELSLALYGSEF